METVQEQQLQLKMKFLLSYNKKIVVLRGRGGGGRGGGKNFGASFFLVEEDYPRFVRMMEF